MMFFFSSRRRHTRFDCDWSSDVCSSDLAALPTVPKNGSRGDASIDKVSNALFLSPALEKHRTFFETRSEERRVGKECRSGCAPYHEKNTNTKAKTGAVTYG